MTQRGDSERGNVYKPKPTTVLGWRSPWSGDENDPIPRRYWLWVRLHWTDMRLRHRLRLHAWRSFPLNDGQRCDWCGAHRSGPYRRDAIVWWLTGGPFRG